MKKILFILLLACTSLWAQVPPPPGIPSPAAPRGPGAQPAPVAPAAEPGLTAIAPKNPFNLSEADLNHVYGKDEINFKAMTIDEFLQVYAETVNRTILRPGTLPAPTITLRNQTPITRREAIQLLDAVLGINGIAMIPVGEKFVKAVPIAEAGQAGGQLAHGEAKDLPELGPYVTHVVQLKYTKPSEMVPVIQPFAKIPNSILPIEGNGVLVIRDFSENVKRMLEMIAQVDIAVPAEFISEVIPIKYALAGDIASALNSLGGGGGGASIGSSSASSSSRGTSRASTGRSLGGGLGGGLGTQGYQNNTAGGNTGVLGQTGGANAGGTFTDRLRSIISKASSPSSGGGSGDIQIFGQTKIIADERTNSLLVYATREDMVRIKDVISKLDVVLSQVLIESIILGVNGNSTLDYGVTAGQSPASLGANSQGGGTMNNDNNVLGTGTSFLNQLVQVFTTNIVGTTTNITSTFKPADNASYPSGSGLAYFGNINKTWDVALKAIATSSKTEVIQRPVIMTTHATPGSFFVGSTVPYVTSTYYGGSVYGGPSSSYQQLRVGIQLTVTPFINPDGIVVMKIDQAIEDIDRYVKIDGNDVPQTASRTLSADITVRDRDTIVLGGYMASTGSKTKSGVPLLQDIPFLGALFRSTGSTKDRKELVVLMRPTVLKTPELAAVGSRAEERRMPGIYSFEKRLRKDEEDFQKKMDKLDGIEKKKKGDTNAAPADLPPINAFDQTERLRQSVIERQAELDKQPAASEPAPSLPPAEPRPLAPEVQPTPETQPTSPEWSKPANQTSGMPADSFKSAQPMSEEEKRAYGRVDGQ